MKTLFKIIGLIMWFLFIGLVDIFNPMIAYGLAALTIWAMIPYRAIDHINRRPF